MRLLSLHLEKYGAFADRLLQFRPEPLVHIVFGPNETGKTTALQAVRDLLFGFPERTQMDFRFKTNELRIGGAIAARDGRKLEFSRRKGRARTLLSPQGGDLPDDALAPFLGALNRDVFARAFGIDASALRAGAEDMLKNRGAAGESLMAAASGLRGLSDLRKTLDEEASGIFTSRAAKDRRFYQALERHEAARKTIRERELRGADWRRLEDDIAAREQRLTAIKARRADLDAELHRIRRFMKLKPRIAAIDAAAVALDVAGEAAALPRGFGDDLGKALSDVAFAEQQHDEAIAKLTQASNELGAIEIDPGLLSRKSDIDALFSSIVAYRSAARDRIKVKAQADDLHVDARELAASLGFADIEDIAANQPAAAEIAAVAALIRDGERLANEQRALEDAQAREDDALARIDRERLAQGPLADPAPLREKLTALGDIGASARERDREAARLASDERALEEDAARLSPSVLNLDAMARAALPQPDMIARFRKEFEDGDFAARTARTAIETAGKEVERATAALAALAGGRPVATAERIEAARTIRDAHWKALRGTLFGERDSLSGAALLDTVSHFEVSTMEADRLADEAARDADRVSEHRNRAEERARALECATAAELHAKTVQQQRDALSARWTRLWSSAEVEPTAPTEMAGWLSSLRALIDRRCALAARKATYEALQQSLLALSTPLETLASEMGLSAMAGLDAGRMATRLAERLKVLDARWDAMRDLNTRRDEARARRMEIATRLQKNADARENWRTQWSVHITAMGLRAGISSEAAAAALDAWKKAPALLRERASLVDRVRKMARDNERFEEQTGALVAEIAPDFSGLSAPDAVEALHKLLTETNARDASRRQIARQKAELEKAVEIAAGTLKKAHATLDALAASAPPGAELVSLCTQLHARDKAMDALERARGDFALVADGVDENAARAGLADFDLDRASAEMDSLSRENDALDHEAKIVFADHTDLMRRRDALYHSEGAEFALQQKRSAEAELRSLARDWAVLKIGGLMLEFALERQRAQRADPLLARASSFFETLTGGSFSSVEQRFDDKDEPFLAARRIGDEIVDIPALSEGARDQLFLALRLAYVEDYAARAEPAPFIADDIFASFDDARTGFALQTLGALCAQTQPIIFTHHRHVVEIAQNVLGDGVDVIELGG